MKPRYKKAKRILKLYFHTFGLKPPYRVLVCGSFAKRALTDKINIAEQLPKYLNAEVKLCTTKCAIKEMELGETLTYGPLKVLKQYDVEECPHSWFKGAPKCLIRAATAGKKKFMVATQDEELKEKLRPHHIPLLHISHNSINLENPPESSWNAAEDKTAQKLGLTERQEKAIAKMNEELGLVNDSDGKKRKKKKKGGPNPLSCMKKKKPQKNPSSGVKEGGVGKAKRKRNRKRKPAHLRESTGGE
ncbi:rRNA-processing protein UTP23 homolog [Aplysia californica]|uniref:rRNA-processing protein UTP23 homolog n=1 Tax=Aplysia californica TaxID=6500 RepID=A0ABM0ZZH6_APLCA|nr:rRNA-processing protein UTP23 homolog [Aplysia californica]XP_012937730.1 rRNA-processing protein UTP23 homolog [Aplysia californica]